tara:strand:+ start:22 stop:198 length:177 start_codon:yes stop_codon:yes gene_type:complete
MTNKLGMSDIQKEMIKKPCPHCEEGKLRAVAEEDEEQETCLWCDTCDCSVDTCGGYTF